MTVVRNDDPVPLILDLLNAKSTGLDVVLKTILLCQVSSHSDQGFSFHRANIPTSKQTHIVTKPYDVGA